MIVVTGSVTARQDSFDDVRKLSLQHVHRSRTEPGCIARHWRRISLSRPRVISSVRCNRSREARQPLRFMTLQDWKASETISA
jgi:quinol monooxygenase YgiN